ncbi:MAG: HEAT repeat domain-containing protein, partial [Polyangiales bacterium]
VAAKAKPAPVIALPPVADGSLDSWASGDHDEGDDDGDDGDDPPERKRALTPLPIAASKNRTVIVVLLIAVLGGGGAFLAYRFLVAPKEDAEQDIQKPVTPPPPPPADAAPPPVTAADALTQARAVLVKNLGSESPRVQRVAASALARAGDTQAITYLTAALAKETSDVSRLDLAYALARAGDKKGLDTLAAGLQSARRDVRAQAGRQLALLGDKRAAPVLASYLEVSQLRLGAAEQLAYLADPAAIKALDQVRSDPKSNADEKARATIALGIAGRADVVPELEAMLKDQRFNAFAASALAQLRDVNAKPVLVEQLALPSLRVEAARALRRLDPSIDPAPYLPALLAAMESHKDMDQITVAETILLLAGDAGWSERP